VFMLIASIRYEDNRIHESLNAEGHVTHACLSYRFTFDWRCYW